MSERIHPFANGSQFFDWQVSNCERCVFYPDDATESLCDILNALEDAEIGDGTVDEDIAQRMGQLDHPGEYVWMCPEVIWADWWKKRVTEVNQRSEQGADKDDQS